MKDRIMKVNQMESNANEYKCRQLADYKELVEKLIVLGEKIGYNMVQPLMNCLYYRVKESEVEGNKEQAEELRYYINELEKYLELNGFNY